MQNKTKRLSVLLGLALGAPAVVAPVVMPSHAPAAIAQETAEYPDVPQNHWAYDAINKLSQAGIIEGMPNGTYLGNKPMTRYEFAVAVARILDKLSAGAPGAQGPQGEQGVQGPAGQTGPAGQIPDVSDFVKRKDLQDAINALRNEFAPELKALGVKVDDLDKRVTDIENRLAKPPKLTITPSLLFRGGSANYITQDLYDYPRDGIAVGNDGVFGDNAEWASDGYHQFSYLDFSLRLADRVSDKVTLNAELRSLTGTQEDPWISGGGDYYGEGGFFGGNNSSFYVRQANANIDLNSLKLIIGRQHTKVAQGLLYDNDLIPTDQIQGIFSLGPVNIDAFIGSANNNSAFGYGSGYLNTGAAYWIGLNSPTGGSGAITGFPSWYDSIGGGVYPNNYLEDSESLIRGSINLFKISGKPVQLGASYLFNGVADQKGWGADLTVPLFNRNVGIEYVNQKRYANNNDSNGDAFNITVPVLRSKSVDLTVAYGKASDDFEYFVSSAANPYVRTWGEAVFDRPLALGAPLINGGAYGAYFMAAKKVWDVNATLRFIKKFPISLRWYNAKGSSVLGNKIDLGNVWSVGTNYQIADGIDLELKYGQYDPKGDVDSIKYFRVGANVGF